MQLYWGSLKKHAAKVLLRLSFSWVCYATLSPRFSLTSDQGYYNPLLAYGEDKAIQDAAEAGANGFIMVDLPPEEAITFREKCARAQFVLFQSRKLKFDHDNLLDSPTCRS